MFTSQHNRSVSTETTFADIRAKLTLLLAKSRRFLIEEDEYRELLDQISAYKPVWISATGNRRITLQTADSAIIARELVDDVCLTKYSIPLILSLRDRCLELSVINDAVKSMELRSGSINGV